MSEQLTIDGAAERVGPPPVPPVIFLDVPACTELSVRSQHQCAHCVMNAHRWHQERRAAAHQRTLPEWTSAADVTILRATQLITQVDGSTLYLCAQHAQEHAERGNPHV